MLKKIALVFPGQGSQMIGMGNDIFNNFKVAKEVFEEVNDVLKFNLSKIIFDGPEDELTKTANTQPALMTVSMAIVRVIEKELKKKIFEFSEIMLGHSLGEYSALCASGVISLGDTALLLKTRGESMQNSVKGVDTQMTAVIGLDISQVEDILNEIKLPTNEICEIANDNCPGQIILSGTKTGVELISKKLKSEGAKALINLKVSAPFHCQLMEKVSIIMNESLKPIKFNVLKTDFISNVSADYVNDSSLLKELLVKQVCSRVRWRESINKSSEKCNTIIEIGSGKVLTGLNKRINRDLDLLNISNSEDIASFLNFCGENL